MMNIVHQRIFPKFDVSYAIQTTFLKTDRYNFLNNYIILF